MPRPELLRSELETLHGAGPKLAALAGELGIVTLGDVLLHVPHAHRDHRELAGLGELRIGAEATVAVEVRSVHARPTRRRGLTIVEARVADETGEATAVWFNQRWIAERLQPGTRLLLRGRLDARSFRVAHHEILDGEGAEGGPGRPPGGARSVGRPPAGVHTTGLVPVHPATEGLRPERLREWAWQALGVSRHAIESLPAAERARRCLPGVHDSLVAIHFPDRLPDAEMARERLAFEELALYQVALVQRRERRRSGGSASAFEAPGPLVGRWLDSLPFRPTDDQVRAFEAIDEEITGLRPMQRLLMGEVGSGKTVVAIYAMLRAVESGLQAALMAPTETLAEQHFITLQRLLGSEALPAALLTGSTPAASRRTTLGHLATGQLGLVVGTHALIEPGVEFARLGLVVVDEQHRFGVAQRSALDAKGPDGRIPHVLHMTATPIPRTLSLTAYGDLASTELRELPAGRRPVSTWLVGEPKREGAYGFIRERVAEGRQCYVVCPLVEESEKLQARAATVEAERLAAGPLAGLRIGVLHGQMRSADKQAAMAAFAAGDCDILVATSVIEVGIDVANATVMVIEEADRYGLSQLHQLRGRVGRGEHESHCILFADPGSELARRRLEAISTEHDGFRLAEIDLSLRGEGELLGTRQHGLPRFRVASLPEDAALLYSAREMVLDLLRRYGTLDDPALGPLLEASRARFAGERIAA